jgi:surface protein
MFESKEQLKEVINLYCSDKDKCIEQYGEPNSWNVSNITDMSDMFYKSQFNGDISNWDVSNVTNMNRMFHTSKFNGDISKWNVSNVTNMYCMFHNTKFNGDISNWNVSNVTNMKGMFYSSQFNGDISNWDISSLVSGKEDIIKIGVKIPKAIKIVQLIEEDFKECPVTGEVIEGDYLRCTTCKHCFNMEVEKWIDENKCCPYCRSKWKKKIIYSQF